MTHLVREVVVQVDVAGAVGAIRSVEVRVIGHVPGEGAAGYEGDEHEPDQPPPAPPASDRAGLCFEVVDDEEVVELLVRERGQRRSALSN